MKVYEFLYTIPPDTHNANRAYSYVINIDTPEQETVEYFQNIITTMLELASTDGVALRIHDHDVGFDTFRVRDNAKKFEKYHVTITDPALLWDRVDPLRCIIYDDVCTIELLFDMIGRFAQKRYMIRICGV